MIDLWVEAKRVFLVVGQFGFKLPKVPIDLSAVRYALARRGGYASRYDGNDLVGLPFERRYFRFPFKRSSFAWSNSLFDHQIIYRALKEGIL
ncbi:hypothetical protein [Cohnella nanjingensis]|uniref:hypothetical protein n=1 Tax=Cohnella nanjingensis TaxID=1387779 RepID=UPI00406BAE5F